MKKTNYLQKILAYCSIWFVFWGSFLFPISKNSVFLAQDVPTIEISSPENMSTFDTTNVEITGKVSDDLTPSDQLIIKVFEKINEIDPPLEISTEGILTKDEQDNSIWTYSKEFTEGTHKLFFEVHDGEELTSSPVEFTFTVKLPDPLQGPSVEDGNTSGTENPGTENPGTENPGLENPATENPDSDILSIPTVEIRPIVNEIKVVPKLTSENNTYSPLEDMTHVPVDSKILVLVSDPGTLTFNNPISITSFETKKPVTSLEDSQGTISEKNADGLYELTFTPSEDLNPGTTYYVYVNPTVINDSGKALFPRFLKFTTASTFDQYQFETPEEGSPRPPDLIHGNFSNVTNSCAYCHSTHNGENQTLEGGKFGTNVDNLCLSCHDGTNGQLMPDKYNTSSHKHAEGQLQNSQSCTSCHNPHSSWTKEDPNKLKGITVEDANGSHYQPLSYKKASSSTGVAEDFSLCFRCHNGTNGKDIEKYYKDTTITTQSGHNFTAVDESSLNGQLPCAECHETHGSNNIMMLRDELGNVKLPEDKKYSTTKTTWNTIDEREFCLACHRNNTEIYGRTSAQIEDDGTDGHQKVDLNGNPNERGCSECHGTGEGEERVISSAHAPKRYSQ